MKKIIVLLIGGILLYSCQEEKTAYVDNDKLKENYSALKNSNEELNKKQQEIQAQLQGEGQAFQKKVQDYQEKSGSMSEKDREELEGKLMKEQQNLQQKQQMQQQMLMQEKNKAQDSLVGVMKKEIKGIAKSKGYTYVFGTGNDNIMYGEDSKDITQDILDKLNENEDGDESPIDTTAVE